MVLCVSMHVHVMCVCGACDVYIGRINYVYTCLGLSVPNALVQIYSLCLCISQRSKTDSKIDYKIPHINEL